MSSKTITLDQIRNSLTPEQRHLINTAFDYEQQHRRNIPAVTLFEKCGGEQVVSTALAALPANAVWIPPTNEGRRRYGLRFVGYLLSKRGKELQTLLARYLNHVRAKLQSDPELNHIDFAELKSDAGFTDDELEFFQDFIFLTPFHNGGSRSGSGLPPNVEHWYAVADLYAYVSELALQDLNRSSISSPVEISYEVENTLDNNDWTEPTEIKESLKLFRRDHPDPQKVMFVIMSFDDTALHHAINKAISDTLMPFGISALRADTKQYHDELFYNILTYVHGCGSGVAVFERLEEETFNPNVAFEVGYMMALKKPVCLLKDRTLKTLHSDLAGKMYRQFDAQNPSTISEKLSTWLKDKNLTQINS